MGIVKERIAFWQPMSHRVLILIPALLIFIINASFYMAVDLGTAPYDAICFILSDHLPKIPFRIIRILWDSTAMIIGLITGGGNLEIISYQKIR